MTKILTLEEKEQKKKERKDKKMNKYIRDFLGDALKMANEVGVSDDLLKTLNDLPRK